MHIVILGNGVAGISAALRLRERAPDCTITVISGESRYHYSRPALMYVFMGHMTYANTKPFEDRVWADRRIELVRGWVVEIDTENRRVGLKSGDSVPYDHLVLATGSRSNRFGWPGQDLPGVQGLYGLPDLRALYENAEGARHAVIVGGGLIGIELGEMLHSRNIEVTFLVREPSYWNNVLNAEESVIVNDLIREAGFGLELETELEAIEADSRGRAASVRTKDGRNLDCQIVGLTAGVSPNIGVVESSEVETGRGVLVDDRLRTNVEGVWAAGDCAEIKRPGEQRNLLQQVWYTGKMQGETVADNILGDGRAYDPGIWFNSAKFLDLEYQTYGRVNMHVEGERNLYWQSDDGRASARLVFSDGVIIGLQSMGLRWRHRVAERWIHEGREVEDALSSLPELAFDPEFHRNYTAAIRRAFEEQRA